jgi:hypothetical protein
MEKKRRAQGRVRTAMMAVSLSATLFLSMADSPVPLAAQTGIQSGVPSGTHQTGGTMPASAGGPSPLGGPGALDPGSSPFPDLSRQKRNDDRQRRIVSDTQRLLMLTSQLKAEVASSGAETMSPAMLKQMEEIEKLAKSVKDKMKD